MSRIAAASPEERRDVHRAHSHLTRRRTQRRAVQTVQSFPSVTLAPARADIQWIRD